jgi:hypothetical protein
MDIKTLKTENRKLRSLNRKIINTAQNYINLLENCIDGYYRDVEKRIEAKAWNKIKERSK